MDVLCIAKVIAQFREIQLFSEWFCEKKRSLFSSYKT